MIHIGSTAVIGLAAKPIVDIMLGVDRYPPAESDIKRAVDLGYEAPDEAGVSERLYFTSRGERSFNLHAVQLHGQHWNSNLALREYLRANSAARARYQAAKYAAIASGATDLLAYSEAKADAVTALLAEAVAFQSKDKSPRGVNG